MLFKFLIVAHQLKFKDKKVLLRGRRWYHQLSPLCENHYPLSPANARHNTSIDFLQISSSKFLGIVLGITEKFLDNPFKFSFWFGSITAGRKWRKLWTDRGFCWNTYDPQPLHFLISPLNLLYTWVFSFIFCGAFISSALVFPSCLDITACFVLVVTNLIPLLPLCWIHFFFFCPNLIETWFNDPPRYLGQNNYLFCFLSLDLQLFLLLFRLSFTTMHEKIREALI